MNKKIKIIEILNKIANGEEVPKEIKVNNLDFIWKTLDDGAGYFNIEEGHWLEDCISLDCAEDLNTDVEILEDNTEEIEELELENFEQLGYEVGKLYLDFAKGIAKAVNEIRKEKE